MGERKGRHFRDLTGYPTGEAVHLYLADLSKTSYKGCALQNQQKEVGENSRENGVERALNEWLEASVPVLPSIAGVHISPTL